MSESWLERRERRLAVNRPEAWASRKLLLPTSLTVTATLFSLPSAFFSSLEAEATFIEQPPFSLTILGGLVLSGMAGYNLFKMPALASLSRQELRFPRRLVGMIAGCLALQILGVTMVLILRIGLPKSSDWIFIAAMGIAPAILVAAVGLHKTRYDEKLPGTEPSPARPATANTSGGKPKPGNEDDRLPKWILYPVRKLEAFDRSLLLNRPLLRLAQSHVVIPASIIYLSGVWLVMTPLRNLARESPELERLDGPNPLLMWTLIFNGGALVFWFFRAALGRPFADTVFEDWTVSALDLLSFTAIMPFFVLPWREELSTSAIIGLTALLASGAALWAFVARYADNLFGSLLGASVLMFLPALPLLVISQGEPLPYDELDTEFFAWLGSYAVLGLFATVALVGPAVRKAHYSPRS